MSGDVSYVYLSSADATNPNAVAGQTPQQDPARNANYRNAFQETINFTQPMEVALLSISFVPRNTPTADGFILTKDDSLWVYSDAVDSSNVQVGSQRLQLLAKLLPARYTATGELGGRIEIVPDHLSYTPIGRTQYSSIGIELAVRDGATPCPIDPVPDNGTTVVLGFRPRQ